MTASALQCCPSGVTIRTLFMLQVVTQPAAWNDILQISLTLTSITITRENQFSVV